MRTKLWQRTVSAILAVTLGILNIESTGLFSNIFPLSDMYTAAEDGTLNQVYFKINGKIDFNETTETSDGKKIDWKNIVRPAVFDQEIKVIRKYTDENGDHEDEFPTQEINKQENFYIKFENDGDGGGSFVIDNVPAYVLVDGQNIKVSEYKVIVKPKYEWYRFVDNAVPVTMDGIQGYTTVTLGLNTSKLTVIPTVIPENSDPAAVFTFNTVFESPVGIEPIDDENNTLKYSTTTHINNGIEVMVPIGVPYTVNQTVKDGYKLSNYTIKIGNENATNLSPEEVITQGESDVTVTSSNFSQNLTKSFDVKWIDNNSLSRPKQDIDNYSKWFSIKYKIAGGDFVELTENQLELLGLDKMPELKLSETGAYYTGLSPADTEGEPIEYEVVLKETPDRYMAEETEEDGIKTFKFTEVINFSADIKWNDDSDREETRPKSIIELLELHKANENENGVKTDVTLDDAIIEITPSADKNVWNISIAGLPRYDDNNYEYDYYIYQNPINVTKDPNPKDLSYVTYYENGTGAYGNDISKCHNNGSITEVLSSETDFSAQKVWLDPDADKSKRPDATVTLWRYVSKGLTDVNNDSRIDLDDAYIKGVVSQVMIIDSKNGQETPLSYSLDKSKDNSAIVFSIGNSDGTSKEIVLPGNDDKGQEYVYFVRENLSGENADHYDIHYYDETGKHKYGALSGGTIRNVQSKRVAVNVKKVWKNPESLSAIDGASVQMIISAPDAEGNYKELIIYSEQENSHEILSDDEQVSARTIKGFTADIPFSEVTYYADIYDEFGNKLDMSKAVFEEIVNDSSGHPIDSDHKDDGSFKVAGTKYIPSTTFDGIVTLGDKTDRYSYTQINTAKLTRDYTLIKQWGSGITASEYADIEGVYFRLERISVNDLAKGSNSYEVVEEYKKCYVPKGYGSQWEKLIYDELEKYDENGNQYYYSAREIGFKTTGGEVDLATMQQQRGWKVLYHKDAEKTTAVNYNTTGGGGYFTITKLWQDNSDISGRDDTVVRVYKKTELKDALEQKYNGSESDKIVDIASLGVEYKEITLTEEKNKYYTAEYSFDSPYKRSDFFVIEYSVGSESSNPQPAQYTYGELINALEKNGSCSYSGIVENDNFRFDVNTVCDTNGDYMIVNTRKGETSITVNKKWNDNGNENYRPKEIKFQLYKNEKPYTNVDAAVKSEGAYINIEDGIITVNPNSNKNGWDFTISNLPMFSKDGERLYYNIDEIPEDDNSENNSSVSYIQKKVQPKIDGDEKNQEFTFNFENTITGTTSHVAYKYWKDKDASIRQSNRPDIYFILYRYLKGADKDSAEQYIDYKTQLWAIPAESDVNADYDLKVTIEDLPRFNEDGIEYVYFFEEQLNNDGESVYGKYHGVTETMPSADGAAYEVFTNTIVDYMTIKGTKVWKGFTGLQITDDKYPEPDIYLYRTTRTDINNLQDWTFEDIAYEGLELVDIVKLNDNKKGYNFPNDTPDQEYIENYILVNGKYMLPKFDENGIRYKYLVKESFGKRITDLLYTKTNANGTLTNEFRDDINRCSIKVHKEWERGILANQKEDQYPSVIFSLYRDGILYDEKTITADQFKAGVDECTFDNLLIFSPSGNEYTYTIKEKYINGGIVNGYSVTYYSIYGDASSANTNEISITPGNGLGNDYWNRKDYTPDFEAGTENTYTKVQRATLSGSKIWDDWDNIEGMRPNNPEDIVLILKRSTSNELNQNNAVNNSELGPVSTVPSDDEPYVVWTESPVNENGMVEWKYTIYNLERYAPNGLPYTYILSEQKVDGYKEADSVSKSTKDSENVLMKDLVNKFEGELEVQKVWYDGKNVYNLRPKKVTLQLQRSIDEQNWSNFGDEVEITEKDSLKNTGKNTWHYTFTNLPTINKNGEEYKYRCIETKLDDVDINSNSASVPYTFKASTKPDGTYILENELRPTSLVVTKTWDDEQNLYSSRPDSVKFQLQKQVVDPEIYHWNEDGLLLDDEGNPPDWVKVMDFTLEPDKDGVWKKTLYDLPIAQILKDENKNEYRVYSLYFRAVELDETGKDGHLPNYTKEETHEYVKNKSQNFSDITNILVLNEKPTISAEKVWYKSYEEPVTATFELLYKRTDEDEKSWHCYGKENPIVDPDKMGNHTADGCLTKKISSDSETQKILWTNLPKKDRDGNDLEYKIVEKSIDGYKIEEVYDETQNKYTFTNIELQSYTVQKIWQNVDYAHKAQDGFTAEFQLESRVGSGEWEKVAGSEVTLISTSANDSKQEHTWTDLPMYDEEGNEITYRAAETKINGNAVANDTDGDYIVTYEYDDQNAPSFSGNNTIATNRMIYGFVNLSKSGAYLAPAVSKTGNLQDAEFIIRDSGGNVYASGIKTNEDGHLIRNSDGTYGNECKYLITGTYTLEEVSANEEVPVNDSYSIWENGVEFTIGLGDDITGEHGTAWVKTVAADNGNGIKLAVEYLKNDDTHYFDDLCVPLKDDGMPAYNIESRGIIKFTKTGNNEALDIHDGADGESDAYFGVYLDKDCKKQVAGMSAADKEHFVLTDKAENGTDLPILKNGDGIPYLRNYYIGFSLVSGTYYIKEIVPPAGYVLDKTVREAVISKIDKIPDNKDISELYNSNRATISGLPDNKWNNNPNTVKIYKKDQYGRPVQLEENGYLELHCFDGGTFKNGDTVIRLYQDSSHYEDDNYITYEKNVWTITGLLDADKTYTLSEPPIAVPDNYVAAIDIEFEVNKNGQLVAVSGISEMPEKSSEPTYNNVYTSKENSADNMIVMRDVSRYLKNVALKKTDSITEESLPNISFKLYKVEGEDIIPIIKEDEFLTTDEDGKFLTTDAEGMIDLSKLGDDIINTQTGYPLKYGLDIGTYYFKEFEKGAADRYVIGKDIYFSIENNDGSDSITYSDYADVRFTKNDMVSQGENSNIGVVKNEPVKEKQKLTVSKIDFDNNAPLEGAEFTLDYESITKGDDGSLNTISYQCIIGDDGKLYDIKSDPYEAIDISNKGTYTLKEVKAPALHMTRTENEKPVVMAVFKVESNEPINVTENQDLVTYERDNSELRLTVKNEKTVVNITKLNDIVSGKKSEDQKVLGGETLSDAVLEIYDGTTLVCTLDDIDDTYRVANGEWNLTGILSENTIYRLHEKEENVPVGYMKADDIFFKIYGTNDKRQSVVYVWSGTGEPVLNSTAWKTNVNLENNVLTMVDEAIIAPVDMQKVVGENDSFEVLRGAKFAVKVGDTQIGTAVSDKNGWLVWESIIWENVDLFDSVFIPEDNDPKCKRVTNEDTVEGKTIILQQNESGYTFTEIYAPSHAHNEDKSCTVNITADDYVAYKNNRTGYVNIKNSTWVDSRGNSTSDSYFVNPPYKSTVTLHKYDNDEEAKKLLSPIAGTEFTLYKADGTTPYTKASMNNNVSSDGKFKTGSDGNLNIVIYDKGTYVLKETKATTGYINSNAEFPFELEEVDYNQTKSLDNDEGVPNERKKGKVVFTKKDVKTGEYLNDVEFTLTRIDKPANPANYLLEDSVTVKTGHSYRAEKNTTGNWILTEATGSQGVINIEGLNWGNYTLTESRELSGYILGQTPLSYTFEVKANELEFSNTETNTKNHITLYKTNQIDPEIGVISESDIKGLAGAEFEIHEVTESGETGAKVNFYLNENDTVPTEKVISGADGKVTVYGLPTNNTDDGLKTYHLVETKAPKGYKLQTSPTVFTIDRNGNVTSAGNTEVTMQDEAIKIYIKKFGESFDDKLSGATFELTDICDKCENKGYIADDKTKNLSIDVDNLEEGDMIPIEKVIGGHKYRLTETKAPDGYEATAVVDFTVDVNGKVEIAKTEGGYQTATEPCASVVNDSSNRKATISIRNEKIRSTLTKVDYDNHDKFLKGVVFTLEPYSKNVESSFADGFTEDSRYDEKTGKFTFTTNDDGQFVIPDGLLIHSNEYLLCEIETQVGYYLSKEANEGVILKVKPDGRIDVIRLENYASLSPESCPVTSGDDVGNATLLFSMNKKATSFELEKKVDGNMGDLNGEFRINITAYEFYKSNTPDKPDDEIEIDSKDIVLGLGDTYDSENGENAFGALPVGAKIEIRENNDLDYLAVVVIANGDPISAENGVVTFTLDDSTKKIEIKLTNRKQVPIDMGVDIDAEIVIPIAAFMMLSAWLYLRSRRKRDLI